MILKRNVQEVAVFGESGSGKTVLLSSFYGATQEPSFTLDNTYRVLADNSTQSKSLRQNYLRMRNEGQAPSATKFKAESFSFTLKPKDVDDAKAARLKTTSAMRLIWHDYPGEWFTEEPSTDEESSRRIDTFRNLLTSDVALVLVDGQKLIDYAGEEEKYLKSLFWGLREGLEKLKGDILSNGAPLARFPRIWVLALSKADLHPGFDVNQFHDLIIQKAAGDLDALHSTLKGFVKLPEALSLGEDYVLLSSAKFEPGKIEVAKRVGINLIAPVATMLPLERAGQWAEKLDLPLKHFDDLVGGLDAFAQIAADQVAPMLVKIVKKIPKVGPLLGHAAIPALMLAFDVGKKKLEQYHRQAIADRDYLAATIVQFRLDLERGVDDHVLVKSTW